MKRALTFFFVLSGAIVSAEIAFAEILNVPSGLYTTIQAGVYSADPGDTVLVADGIYSGAGNTNIDLMGKAITVKSQNGAKHTIIDCGGVGRAFSVNNAEDANTVIEGFTIQGGNLPDWPEGGGGIYCSGTAPIIRSCIFKNNHGYFGGGIYFDAGAAPTIEKCQLTANSANYGAALYGKESSPVIKDCKIIENAAKWDGGGLYLDDCTDVVLSDSLIESNTALNKSGGGVFEDYSTGSIRNCEFKSNVAGGSDGGAINTDRMEITDSLFVDNYSKDDGGAIFNAGSAARIANCYFIGNSADGAGGAIYFCVQAASLVENCVFVGNDSPSGGAIYCFWHKTCQPEIVNCTISNNTGGSGIYCASGGQPKISNTILWDNEPAEITSLGDPITVAYSDIQGGYPGTDNIAEDPLFVDPVKGNYRLSSGSPCIDSGTAVGASSDDIVGNVRPEGDGYDMGAYEYVGVQPGDTEPDGDVDGSDLSLLAAEFGRTDCDAAHPCGSNCDGDNDVDETDLINFVGNFGRSNCR